MRNYKNNKLFIKSIKFICPKCGHIEQLSYLETISKLIFTLIFVLGLIFLAQMFMIGPGRFVSLMVTSTYTKLAEDNSVNLRHLALNYTTYDGLNSFAFAQDLLKNFPRVRYVLNSKFEINQNPSETFLYGGDCKHMSVLFAGMMMSVGYDAYVDCDFKHSHCVVNIPYRGSSVAQKGSYMIVDLTGDALFIYDKDIDHWNQQDNYTYSKIYDKEFRRQTLNK